MLNELVLIVVCILLISVLVNNRFRGVEVSTRRTEELSKRHRESIIKLIDDRIMLDKKNTKDSK